MSKRSKEMALKAYPVHSVLIQPARSGGYYADGHLREGFIEGYEQAEKDTIERAIQWLTAHADDYIVDMEVSRYKPSKLHVGGMCWEHLKQAMEEE